MEENNYNASFDFKKELFYFLVYWKWFVTAMVVFLGVAYFYLKSSQDIFQSETQIQIIQENQGAAAFLLGQESFAGEQNSIENEIIILRSERILELVVEKLNLQTSVYRENERALIWGDNIPFAIEWLNQMSEFDAIFVSPKKINQKDGFLLRFQDKEYELSQDRPLINDDFKISISNTSPASSFRFPYIIKYNNKRSVLEKLNNSLIINQNSFAKDNVNLIIKGPNSNKNNAILNELVSIFQQDRINDKREVYRVTIRFIDKRLDLVENLLDSIEKNSINYKQSNVLFNSQTQTQSAFNDLSKLSNDFFNIDVQKEVANSLIDDLKNQKPFILLPTNLGISDTEVNGLVFKYNTLITERDQLLLGSTQNNPLVMAVTSQLLDFKQNILLSLDNYIEFLDNSLKKYQDINRNTKRELSTISIKESELKGIYRNFEISQEIYIDLLKKRENASIQYEGTLPNVKIVDYAINNPIPVAPKRKPVFFGAFLFSILLPFSVLVLKRALNTRINSKDDVSNIITDLKLIEEVPLFKEINNKAFIRRKKLDTNNSNEFKSEVFNRLRSTIIYTDRLLNKDQKKSEGLMILVTSALQGEGKTFIASNISESFVGLENKKVILVGGDIRNPQIHSLYKIEKSKKGLTNYLVGKEKLASYIHKIKCNNKKDVQFDFLPSGSIPLNPSELTTSKSFETMLNELKKIYDYVIIDSAPTLLVSDTLNFSSLCDLALFVVRSDKSEKRILEHLKELNDKKLFNKIGVIVNGIKHDNSLNNFGYSYRYGYGYGYGYKYGYNYVYGQKNLKG